jgi:diguanylate cyclase (GGDEF)-like protein
VRGQVEKHLKSGWQCAVLWMEIRGFPLFRKIYGDEVASAVLDKLEAALLTRLKEMIPERRFLFVERTSRSALSALFMLRDLHLAWLTDLAMRLRLGVRSQVNQDVIQVVGQNLEVKVGYSVLSGQGHDFKLERDVFRAIEDARHVAEGALDPKGLTLMAEFHRVVDAPLLRSVYQPIVDLRSGDVLGWEALARGPQESYFHSPEILFDFAEEVGCLFKLERACRFQAISRLGELGVGRKLFLNIHPKTMGDPNFRSGQTMEILKENGLSPQHVVLEITERNTIKNFTMFHRTLDHYRSQGYMVAIDDMGTGYSGLSRVAQLRPDYMKVDMSLIRGIDTNPVQRALIETLVTFADKIGSAVVAEGIETPTELSSLMSLGVHFGQGYYLAKPAHPKPLPRSFDPIQPAHSLQSIREWKCSIPVRDLGESAPTVNPESPVREVKTLLDSSPISGTVVVEGARPIGLVMSHNLDRQLGTYYGTSLYYNKGVHKLMDPHPLIVEGDTPVEMVAVRAMGRDRFKLYDHIIVTEQGLFASVVSVQKMLDALSRVQVEMAKGANPLTGLPGGVALEQEIERRNGECRPYSLIYVDLDHFKVYNDTYGFDSGDKMLRLLADILTWAARRHSSENHFVGHVGGDDFVVITWPERSERVSRAVVRCFQRLVKNLYTKEDRLRGWVTAKGREGREGRYPLVAVSLGIVDCVSACDLSQIGQRAAEVKTYAKSRPGNVYVRDRRAPLGSPQSEDEDEPDQE